MIVELVARTVLVPGALEKLGYRPHEAGTVSDGDELHEAAGRECYQSWGRPNPKTATNQGYLDNILTQGHYSTLEHSSLTFSIRKVTRSLTHELVRHRHFSFCLAGDTKVYLDRPNRKGDGKWKSSQTRTLSQLWEMWQGRERTYVKTMTIRTVTDTGHVVHGHIKQVIQSGIKQVYQITTQDGHTLKASEDHLFWRPDGSWSRLGDLRIGDMVISNGMPLLHDRDWLRSKVAEGFTTPQIAALVGAAPVTVRKWRRIHECPAEYGSGTRGKPSWNNGLAGRYNLPPWSEASRDRLKKTISETRPARPETWTNGHQAANRLFADLRAQGCRLCGTVDGRIELDHIDGNPSNNVESNIQPLCVPCHKAKTNGTPALRTYPSQIVSIDLVGPEMTYDLEMDGPYHRFIANGLVVHNSQVSQRYVDESHGEFIPPPEFWRNGKNVLLPDLLMTDLHQEALDVYEKTVEILVENGVPRKRARQAARAILPNGHETRLLVSGNIRAWREFVGKRIAVNELGEPLADLEMHDLACMILIELHKEVPNSVQDLWDQYKGLLAA